MTAHAPYRLGPYLLVKSLKKGGMARVFVGVHPDRPERWLAVKTLLPELARQRLYREMFTAEGAVGRHLLHPNVVRTVDTGEDRGTPYLVMEYVFGLDLSTLLRKLREDNDRLPAPVAVSIAHALAGGLAHAHALCDAAGAPLNIVNRDISPGNIMLGADGSVKLIDFGIAQTTIDVKSQIGSIKGKISYMAPEQVRGLPVDPRCDLFSLGTVLYEMLTGIHVFHAEGDFATMEKVRRAEAPPPSSHVPEIDAELDGIVMSAMCRDLANRTPDAATLHAALGAWLDRHGGPCAPEALAHEVSRRFGRRLAALDEDLKSARDVALQAHAAPRSPLATSGAGIPLIDEEALADLLSARPSVSVAGPVAPGPASPAPVRGEPGRHRGLSWALMAAAVLGTAGLLVWRWSGP